MVTKEHLANGVLSYIDNEIIPKLPTGVKWLAGTAVCLVAQDSNTLLDTLFENKFVKSVKLVDECGLIDADRLFDALYASSKKYGNLELTIPELPILGTLKFYPNDVTKLKSYVCSGGSSHDESRVAS